MQFEKLFEPIVINGMRVKNRMVMTSISNLFATTNGEVTQRSLDYYAARARGGVGLLIVEYANVQHEGKGCVGTMLGCYSDKLIPGLFLLARTIRENGARAVLQIAHAGRQTFPEFTETPTIKAASAIPLPVPGYPVPEEMSLEEVEETIDAFGKAALRVKEAGFDAVEVHGAHGYLPFGFFSPLQNIRTDKYGGSLNNRMRFGVEIVQSIRGKVGPDFPIGYKLSADEYLEGGITLQESIPFAKELQAAGIDWFQCSAGNFASVHHTVQPMYLRLNHNVHLAEAMKKELKIPVMTVGRHGVPDMMEEILFDGKADMIAMGRQLVCDPDLPNKIRLGQIEDIRRCIGCNEGCNGYFFKNWPITCTINPEVGREAEYAIKPVKTPKKVLVVGGGPAGMEAARVAAIRGHHVTIFERRAKLGGQLNVASVPEFKKDIEGFTKYQERQVRKAGMKIELSKEATVESVREFGADAVLVATGAKPIKPSIPGIDSELVFFAEDALKNDGKIGKKVVIVGGGYIGCETALFLAKKGRNVIIAEMREAICLDAEMGNKMALEEMLSANNVAVRTNLRLQEIGGGESVFVNEDGKKESITADSIVLAMGYRSDDSLIKSLDREIAETYRIGDCVEARDLLGAMHDGAHIGRLV